MSRYVLEFFFSHLTFLSTGFDFWLLPPFLPSFFPPLLSSFLLTFESSYRNFKGKFEERNKNLSFPTLCAGKSCLAWPGCPLRVQTWGWLLSRAKSLAPVSSDLRTDRKRLALVFPFHSTCLAADFSMPGAPGHVSNLETYPRGTPIYPQLLLCLLIPG